MSTIHVLQDQFESAQRSIMQPDLLALGFQHGTIKKTAAIKHITCVQYYVEPKTDMLSWEVFCSYTFVH